MHMDRIGMPRADNRQREKRIRHPEGTQISYLRDPGPSIPPVGAREEQDVSRPPPVLRRALKPLTFIFFLFHQYILRKSERTAFLKPILSCLGYKLSIVRVLRLKAPIKSTFSSLDFSIALNTYTQHISSLPCPFIRFIYCCPKSL